MKRVGRAFARPPVGHEGAGPAPLAAQDGGVEVVVVVVPEAVDLVVAAHDVVGLADLHADFERPQVDFAEGAFGAARIVGVAVGLLVVQREVLRHGGSAGLLDALRHGRRHKPGEERVFGVILEVAAAERIAVNVHAGAEDAVDAAHFHLQPDLIIHRFDQVVVPRAGEQGTDGQQRSVRGETQAGGAVAGRDGRDALVADALERAAEDGGVARGAEPASHAAVAAEEGFHFGRRELGDEFVQRILALLHVDELDALVAGFRNGLREAFLHARREVDIRDRDAFRARDELAVLFDGLHAVECDGFGRDGERGLELFDHEEGVEFRAAAILRVAAAVADVELVFAGFEDPRGLMPGHAAVVERGAVLGRDREREFLGFAGFEQVRLRVGDEDFCGFAELALRRAAVDLHDFAAGVFFAGVLHDDLDGREGLLRVAVLHGRVDDVERGVAEAESERIQDLFRRERLEVAVPDVDVLGVVVELAVAEARGRRVVLVGGRDGGRELAGRRLLAGQDVHDGVAGLHAALPDVHEAVDLVVLHPRHVDHVAHVQQHDRLLERAGDFLQEELLGVGEVIAAGFEPAFAVFARGAADHEHGGVGALGRGLDLIGVEGHFGGVERPVAPAARAKRIRLRPGLVGVEEFLIRHDLVCFREGVGERDAVRRLHVAAGAVADQEGLDLRDAEERDLLRAFLPEREHVVVVFEHHDALGCRPARVILHGGVHGCESLERKDGGRDGAGGFRGGLHGEREMEFHGG